MPNKISTLAANIQTIALRKGLTANAVAKKAGIQTSSLTRLLNGEAQTLRSLTLQKVAAVLGVPPDILKCEGLDLDPVSDRTGPSGSSAPIADMETIPVFTLEQLKDMDELSDDPVALSEIKPVEFIPAPSSDFIGKSIVAIRHHGRAMFPELSEGDILFIKGFPYRCATKMPRLVDGDRVVATTFDSEVPLVRAYVQDENSAGWLMSTNPDWPGARTCRIKKVLGVLAARLSFYK